MTSAMTEVTNNAKTFSCRETRAKCTLCNERNAATNNIGHEVINNAKTFSCRETRAKCTLCNEINVATNNIGHEVTNNLKPSHAGKLEQNVLYAIK